MKKKHSKKGEQHVQRHETTWHVQRSQIIRCDCLKGKLWRGERCWTWWDLLFQGSYTECYCHALVLTTFTCILVLFSHSNFTDDETDS